MDSSIKSAINIFVIMIGTTLLLSCINFYIIHNNAVNILYAIVQKVEIYGPEKLNFSEVEEENNIQITVSRVDLDQYYQYEVNIEYRFCIGLFDLEKKCSVKGLTRLFER